MKKDYTPIKFVIVIFMVMISVMYAQAQSILPHSATIVNNIVSHPRVFHSNTGFAKTSICGVDTVNYTFNKTTSFQSITLNASTSGNIFAQWYPAAGAITVSGFDFYAWQAAGSSAVVTLILRFKLVLRVLVPPLPKIVRPLLSLARPVSYPVLRVKILKPLPPEAVKCVI